MLAWWVESTSRASVQDRKSDESTAAWDESTAAGFFWDESGTSRDESGARPTKSGATHRWR